MNAVDELVSRNNPPGHAVFLSVCKLLDLCMAMPAHLMPQFQVRIRKPSQGIVFFEVNFSDVSLRIRQWLLSVFVLLPKSQTPFNQRWYESCHCSTRLCSLYWSTGLQGKPSTFLTVEYILFWTFFCLSFQMSSR